MTHNVDLTTRVWIPSGIMPKAFSYIRFSRPEQMRGDSLRRQREAAEKWAGDNGLVIDESLTDLGVSAFRGLNRITGALGKFLTLVEEGKVPRGSFLIIESLDRFSRQSVFDVLPEFTKLLRAGITIVTLIDRQVYSEERIKAEPMALFGSLMVMMRAHEESATKASRLSDSWEKKRRDADTKVVTAKVPGWLRVVKADGERKVEFTDDGKEIVQRIFSETIHGYGRRQVALRLKNAGFKPFSGGTDWPSSYIKKILESRTVLGEMQPYSRDKDGIRNPAGPPLVGYYPAAVSEADFVRANASKAKRMATGGKRGPTGVVNLLRGLAWCGCGSRMLRENKGVAPRGSAYLVCSAAVAGSERCDNRRRWRIDRTERLVLDGTGRIDVARLLAPAAPDTERGPTQAEMEDRIAALEVRLEGANELVENRIRGGMERAKALNAELDAAHAQLAEMRLASSRQTFEPTPGQRRATIRELYARMDAATDEERADLRTALAQQMRASYKKVVFGRHHIDVIFRGVMPYGQVNKPTDVRLTIFNDDPNYIAEQDAGEQDEESRQYAKGTLGRLRRSKS